MDLAALMRAARHESCLTQAEVARRAGVTPQALSRWESGSRPIRSDDADGVLAACGLDARFRLVPRHTDLDQKLAELAALPVHDRAQQQLRLLLPGVLDDLQATGAALFTRAWAAAAYGLPALRRHGGMLLSPDPAEQARVAAVLRQWSPVLQEEGRTWGVSWDDQVFQRNPVGMWSAAVLGDFHVEVTADTGIERRVPVGTAGTVSWRVVTPERLVPDDVDATTLARWERLQRPT